jgi:hypothetical protein
VYKLILLINISIIFDASSALPKEAFRPLTSFQVNIPKDTSLPDSSKDVVKITRSWELPSTLKKVSGIDYLEAGKMACIQDETGTIYIYNLESKSIEKEIPFGPPGDYEGIAIVNENAYVGCADGRILEILNFRSDKPIVKEYGTHLTIKQSVGGLCYDKKNKRLLIAVKGGEDGNKFYKSVYSFDLVKKTVPLKPAIKINLKDPVFNNLQTKKLQMVFQPSDIGIHPVTRDFYLIDGVRSLLLVTDESGIIKSLNILNKTLFVQPEGVTFSPSGELYIANKGIKEEPGMLMLVHFK